MPDPFPTTDGYSWYSTSFEPAGNRGSAGSSAEKYLVDRTASGLTKVSIKKGTATVSEMYVWVVDIGVTPKLAGAHVLHQNIPLGIRSTRNPTDNGYTAAGHVETEGTIAPASIIPHPTNDNEKPNFLGQARQRPPGSTARRDAADEGVPSISSANPPNFDSGGEYFSSWDMTRQATRRVVPNENTDLDFTMTPAEGNDDAGVSDDESDEPYAAPFGTVGKLYIEDIPATYFSDLTGNDNDEKSYKIVVPGLRQATDWTEMV